MPCFGKGGELGGTRQPRGWAGLVRPGTPPCWRVIPSQLSPPRYPPKPACGHCGAMAWSADGAAGQVGDRGRDAQRQSTVTAPCFPGICLVSPSDRRAEVSPGQTCPLGAREEVGDEQEPCPDSSVLPEGSWGWGPREGFVCRSCSPQRGRRLLGRVPSRPAAVRCHSAAASPPDATGRCRTGARPWGCS